LNSHLGPETVDGVPIVIGPLNLVPRAGFRVSGAEAPMFIGTPSITPTYGKTSDRG